MCWRETYDNLHILMLYSSSYVAGMKISKRIHGIIDFKNLLHYQKGVCENEVPLGYKQYNIVTLTKMSVQLGEFHNMIAKKCSYK